MTGFKQQNCGDEERTEVIKDWSIQVKSSIYNQMGENIGKITHNSAQRMTISIVLKNLLHSNIINFMKKRRTNKPQT